MAREEKQKKNAEKTLTASLHLYTLDYTRVTNRNIGIGFHLNIHVHSFSR